MAREAGGFASDVPGPGPVADGRAPLPVFVLAAGAVALQLATGGRYPLFRDELYYLACASHLDWGYVDHPPLSIAVLALVRALLGDSLPAVRLVPALLLGLLVWLGARLAGELGGGRRARSTAALAVLVAPQYLAIHGFYSMNAFDLVFWAGAALLLARLVRTGDARLWRPLGLVVGLGLMNKLNLLFFVAGLGAATLATPLRRHLVRREPWQGAALAALLCTPYVLWQVGHEWATVEFMRNATRYKIAPLSPLAFLGAQITGIHPFNAPLWLGGLAWLLAGAAGRRFRALGIVYLGAFALLLVLRGKAYYLGPAYPMLLAAGAVAFERGLAARGWSRVAPALLAVLAAGGAVTAPLVIPVLPVETLIAYQRALGVVPVAEERAALGPLAQHFADRFGWTELTAAVARVYRSLPAEERAAAVILANNYGEAAALLYYGRALGLPPAVSQHNSFYFWGPGRARVSVVIAVGKSTEDMWAAFKEVEVRERVEAPYAMPFETRRPIHVGRGLRLPLPEAWRRWRMFI